MAEPNFFTMCVDQHILIQEIQSDQLETTPKNFQISHPIHILKRLLEDQNVGHLRKNHNHVGCRWRKGLDKGM